LKVTRSRCALMEPRVHSLPAIAGKLPLDGFGVADVALLVRQGDAA